jgi:hypothetical protein
LQQHELLQGNQAIMITLNDSLSLDQVLSGMKGKVYDGEGNLMVESELQRIFNERHERRIPWRAENLDALFESQGHRFSKVNCLYLSQSHAYSEDEGLNPDYSEPLDTDTLMLDKKIDLVHFIREAHTSQGLPRQDVNEGDFYYFYPRDGSVAWFSAYSGRVGLDCNGDPDRFNHAVGVRTKISTGNLNHSLEELRDKYKVCQNK